MIPKVENPFSGPWDITDTEIWAPEDLDLLGPPEIVFGEDSLGTFRCGALEADLDYRIGYRDGGPFVKFSWDGADDMEPVSGRGWAACDGQLLRGGFFIHRGDDCEFTARRRS